MDERKFGKHKTQILNSLIAFVGCAKNLESMTRLQQLNRQSAERNEALRVAVRDRLRSVLRHLVPVNQVVVFGSLTKPHRFTDFSDIDIALESEPAETSLYQLTALLAEELGRPVDIILLSECRFRDRIAREGEIWTLTA